MKSSAVLINVARGEVVDQQALVEACASSQIAGAVLDVRLLTFTILNDYTLLY